MIWFNTDQPLGKMGPIGGAKLGFEIGFETCLETCLDGSEACLGG